ncbi:hypothetical protein [Nocardia amamiensis]|uniref:hypothetical protein n=1 Tax=Nocardia amamiensis TaxID=404578 RepID=UPI0033ECEC75
MSTTAIITAADLVAKIRELVAAVPDATTPTLAEHPQGDRYVVRDEDGTWRGSRLIGRALLALGADPEQLAEHDAGNLSAATTVLSFVSYSSWGQDLLWLNVIQRHEGRGMTWERAVALADLRIPAAAGAER